MPACADVDTAELLSGLVAIDSVNPSLVPGGAGEREIARFVAEWGAGDRLYGRGAYDMKAGLAAALAACWDASSLRLAGDVVVAAVADEEWVSLSDTEAVRRALVAVAAKMCV